MLKAFSLKDARSVVVQTLILAMIAAAAGVFHVRTTFASYTTPTPSCYDIVGSGQPVPVGGVNNSGVVNFDPISGNPLYQYEACAIDPDDDPTVGLFELRGWAWDDNLGWISFYCPPGGGATNEGIACSNASYTLGYGVKVDPVTGKFSGYAWGDNVGWISFNNPGFSTVKVDATNPGCQGYVYSVKAGCPAHSKADTAAWSDNVGWLDFDGIVLPWYSLIAEINDAGVQVSITPDPSTLTMLSSPKANNSDKYTLLLHIQDKKGNPVDYGPGDRYTVTATPEWTFDTVKKDQIEPAGTLSIDNKTCADTTNGAVTKPCSNSDMTYGGSGTGNLSADIKSYAPTSNMNGWDKNADGVMDFSYEGFTLPSSMGAVQPNRVVLKDVLVSIVDNDAGGACVYGNPGTCAPKAKVPTYADPSKPDLKFLPQTNVAQLQDHKGNTDYIEIGGSAPWPFPTTITGTGTVTFTAGIEPVPSPHDYDFLFDTDGSGVLENPGDLSTATRTAGSTPLSAGLGAQIDPDTKAAKPVPALVPGLYMYSQVNETTGGVNVQYYSNKFPKTVGSYAVTPIAVLQGNVYSSGAAATVTAQAVRSLGDVSTNILRDTIFRNVSAIIAGVQKPSGDAYLADVDGGTPDIFHWDTTKNHFLGLIPDENGDPRVFYVNNGDLTLEAIAVCNSERTFIVTGGNVYIHGNIETNAFCTGTAKGKFGIIVLKDFTADASTQATQGHVYIDPGVTHIQANIFADGSIFSAPVSPSSSPEVQVNSAGEPTYASDTSVQENTLKFNQLLIQGSIASQNTVGGAQQSPPITGTGQAATWSDPTLQARLYDLNYLRYYTGVVKRNGAGIPLCGTPPGSPIAVESDFHVINTDGTPWTVYDSPPGCLYSPVDPTSGKTGYVSVFPHTGTPYADYVNLGATYISFDPPTPTLPGFAAQAGGQQQQLPQ